MRVLARPAYRGINPYCQLLALELVDLGVQVEEFATRPRANFDYDICHINWPRDVILYAPSARQAVLRGLLFLRLMLRLSWQGTRLVWTVHDIYPHERRYPRIESWFDRAFMPLIHGTIYLSESSRAAAHTAHRALRHKPSTVIPHGHYRDAYPKTVTRAFARQAIGLPPSATVLSFCGQLRPYKNVPHLIRQFRALPDSGLRLIVAGQPRVAGIETDVRQAAAGDPRVLLAVDFIPDDKLQLYLQAADLVVLPFSEISNSGSALLALSFDRPLLVPDRGSLPDLQQQVGSDWVKLYPGELTPQHLQEACQWAFSTSRSPTAPLDALSWTAIATQTREFYASLLADSPRASQQSP